MKALWRGSWGRADVATGLLLVLFGVTILAATARIQESYSTDPLGPRFLPNLLATVLIGLSLLLTLRGALRLRARRGAAGSGVAPPSDRDVVGRPEPAAAGANVRVIQGIVVMGLYVLLLPMVGYALGSLAFFLALLAIAGERRRRMTVLQATVVTAVLYLLFGVVLDVELPGGLLPPLIGGGL